MDKRLLTALFLCFLLLWVHSLFFAPKPPAKGTGAAPGRESATEGEKGEALGGAKGTAAAEGAKSQAKTGSRTVAGPGASKAAPAPEGASSFPASKVPAEKDITLDTEVYRAVFSNKGGVLKSLKFKHYFTDPDVQKDPEKMSDPANWFEIMGEIRDGRPCFVLKEAGGEGSFHRVLDDVLWESKVTKGDGGGNPTRLTFTLRTGDGLVFRKIFTFRPDAFHLDVDLEVENLAPGRKETLTLVMEGIAGIFDKNKAAWTMGPTAMLDTVERDNPRASPKLIKRKAKDLKSEPFSFSLKGGEELRFAGAVTNYFALLFKPGTGKLLRRITFGSLEDSGQYHRLVDDFRKKYKAEPNSSRQDEFHEKAVTNIRADLYYNLRVPAPGKTASQSLLLYAGPKLTDLMKKKPYEVFYPVIEDSYGSITALNWINKVLIWILKQFHSLFGNWGVAIIFLTIVVKALLFPLNRVQQVSMYKYQQKMAKMKPKLDELKKKYKNNKKKYNEAQMKLMKEHGATPPLLGCLLVFFQGPIFLGLFQALRTSFELRHSPFCLWIKDLSQPDALPLPFSLPLVGNTLNVVPLLMMLAFFFQQKAMPKPADSQGQQTQKIMMFMPFLFGIMFYNYAAGLSLYWMTSNLISIGEYKFIRKKFPVGGAKNGAVPVPAKG